MAHSLSWIDRDRFHALVEETAWRPPPKSEPAPTDAPPEPERQTSQEARPEFVLRRDELVSSQARAQAGVGVAPRARSVPQRGARSVTMAARPASNRPGTPLPLPPPPSYEPTPQPFEPRPNAGVEARLQHLLGWACELTGLPTAYVADADGLLIATNATDPDLETRVAASVARARELPGQMDAAPSGTLVIRAGGETLVLSWEQTRHGRAYLRVLGLVPAADDAVPLLPRALRDALR